MPCYSPLVGYRSRDLNPSTGKRSLVFDKRKAFSHIERKIPCGQCIGCRLSGLANGRCVVCMRLECMRRIVF